MLRAVFMSAPAVILISFCAMARAQEQGPPPPGPMGPPPSMNVNQRLKEMTRRYSLSDAQQAQIRPILETEKKRMDASFQDSSLSREDMFHAMSEIRKDEVSRISPILNDKQRARYQKDQERNAPGLGEPGPDMPSGPPTSARS